MKTCNKCNTSKSLDQFHKRSSAKDGYRTQCKACVAEFNRKRYEAKSEEIKARVMKRYKEIGQKAYYETQRSYAQAYYQKNKERINKRNAEYAKNNPEVRRGIKARYRAQLVKGMTKLDRKKSTLYRKRIKDQPCVYCGKYTDKMHDDHYYPIARGGTDHWFNLVRSCSTCNQKKNARLASVL